MVDTKALESGIHLIALQIQPFKNVQGTLPTPMDYIPIDLSMCSYPPNIDTYTKWPCYIPKTHLSAPSLETCHLITSRIRQFFRSITTKPVRDQTTKRRRPSHPRSQRLQAPKLGNKLQNRSMRELILPRERPILHHALPDVRRNQQRRHADTEPIKAERILFPIVGFLGVSQVIAGWDTGGRGHVVCETSVLVPGENEEGLVPLRRAA